MKKLDLTGQKFGRLTVIEEYSSNSRGSSWRCICECQNEKIAQTRKLRNGSIKSCGCLNNELRRARFQESAVNNTKYTPLEASARRVWKGRYDDGNISFEEFMVLSQLNCYYCSRKPSNKHNAAESGSSDKMKKEGIFIYNGLDRDDQIAPHTKENCVPCCWPCNKAKGTMSRDEFIVLIKSIYEHLKTMGII